MIYFIKAEGQDLVKVGYSKRVSSRLRQLQTGTPHKLSVIDMQVGGVEEEREWHKNLSDSRHRGEWFRYDHFFELIENLKPTEDGLMTSLDILWRTIEMSHEFDGWSNELCDKVRPIQDKISEALNDDGDGLAIDYYDAWQLLIECEKQYLDTQDLVDEVLEAQDRLVMSNGAVGGASWLLPWEGNPNG